MSTYLRLCHLLAAVPAFSTATSAAASTASAAASAASATASAAPAAVSAVSADISTVAGGHQLHQLDISHTMTSLISKFQIC